MDNSIASVTRDVLRELGDPSDRAISKEMVLRHIIREANYIAHRFPNIVRDEGSPTSDNVNEVDIDDLLTTLTGVTSSRISIIDVWVDGIQGKRELPTDMEGAV